MDSKGKFTKNCGIDFLHQKWGITSGDIKVRRNIPKDKFTILDRQYKDHQYPTTISYCSGCIAYVEKHVQNVNRREIDVHTSYETTSVGSKQNTSQWIQEEIQIFDAV